MFLFPIVIGKVNMVAMATQGAMDKGAHAGNLIKGIAALVGGGGGGRPNMASGRRKKSGRYSGRHCKSEEVLAAQV